jgi:hypothetical protein
MTQTENTQLSDKVQQPSATKQLTPKITKITKNKISFNSSTAFRTALSDKIKSLGDIREWDEAKESFNSKKRPAVIEYAAIIYAARVCKEQKEGMNLYDLLIKEFGQNSVNLYIYDNIISLNLDYGDDLRALTVFSDLIQAEKQRIIRKNTSTVLPAVLTPASQISLQKCIFNALRASLNIQFQNTDKTVKKVSNNDNNEYDSKSKLEVNDQNLFKMNEIDFFDSSSPSNDMESTISSILDMKWTLLPKDKSLIVRAYASWNMTTQLAQMTNFMFQDPLPDMWTLETHMKAMLEEYPELALLSLQWYLPLINNTNSTLNSTDLLSKYTDLPVKITDSLKSSNAIVSENTDLKYKGIETILSGIISNTIMSEKRRGVDLDTYRFETVTARCLGLAVKALARLDYYVGHPAKVDAILRLLQYAEDVNDLTAGLVVAGIGACRDLDDWQGD